MQRIRPAPWWAHRGGESRGNTLVQRSHRRAAARCRAASRGGRNAAFCQQKVECIAAHAVHHGRRDHQTVLHLDTHILNINGVPPVFLSDFSIISGVVVAVVCACSTGMTTENAVRAEHRTGVLAGGKAERNRARAAPSRLSAKRCGFAVRVSLPRSSAHRSLVPNMLSPSLPGVVAVGEAVARELRGAECRARRSVCGVMEQVRVDLGYNSGVPDASYAALDLERGHTPSRKESSATCPASMRSLSDSGIAAAVGRRHGCAHRPRLPERWTDHGGQVALARVHMHSAPCTKYPVSTPACSVMSLISSREHFPAGAPRAKSRCRAPAWQHRA